MDVAEVVQTILDELEPRQADAIEGNVVGAAGIAGDHGGGADVVERLQPGLEDRHYRQVFLGMDAAEAARAVVHVEVGGEAVVFALLLQRTGGFAQRRRQRLLLGIGRFRPGGEVPGHVRLRTDQALLLAAPQRDADGAPGLGAHRLEDAHGFHHHRHAGGVVGRAGPGVPGIHVRAQHDDLAGLAAAARDLGHGVVAGLVGFVGEACLHVDPQLHWLLALDRARQLVVVLGRHRQLRHARRFTGLARTAAADADDAVVPAADAQGGQHALGDEEFVGGAGQLLPLGVGPDPPGAVRVGVPGHGEHLQFGQAGFVVAVRIRFDAALVFARFVQQQDLARQLALVLVQIGALLDGDRHHFALDRAVGAGRPRLGQGMQRQRARAEHFHAGVAEFPAAAEVVEGLVVDVGQAPLVELAAGPGIGLRHLRRVGQARTDVLGQMAEGGHDLRTMESLLADAADHVQVHRLLRRGHAADSQTHHHPHATLDHGFPLARLGRKNFRI